MRELSLFTGAGGGLLGTHLLGWKPCGYVEFNDYCQRVIAARIADGYLPAAPIFGDVREFAQSGAAEQYRGIADVVTAGFPCQPFSNAGKQLGADDPRNMWPATADIIRIVQPESVLLENVPGLVSSGYFGTVIGDLAEMGYVGRWGVIGASDVGAPHRRKRLWIVAHSESQRHGARGRSGNILETNGRQIGSLCAVTSEPGPQSENLAHADSAQREGRRVPIGVHPQHANACSSSQWWQSDPADNPESDVGRMAPRMAYGVDRIKALGNGQVPRVAASAWRLLA